MADRPRARQAYSVFFPAAALHAALILPLSLWSLLGARPYLPGLGSSLGHAQELLFGFALAVISGYLLGPQPPRRLLLLLGLWLLARVTHVFTPGLPAALPNAAFALTLAALTAPKFMRAAKKWRNHVIGPLLLGLCGLAALSPLAAELGSVPVPILLTEAVLLLSLLMLFMGGRVLAPGITTYLERQGLEPAARLQPELEGALIIAMGLAIVCYPIASLRPLAALALAAAGLLAAVRLLRWQVWRCRRRPDLLGLAAGYAWLAAGLLAIALATATGGFRTVALHLITVGALGSLSIGIMSRVHLQRSKQDPARRPSIAVATVLVGIAALARAASGLGAPEPLALLWLAATAWSLAYLLLARLLLTRG